MQVAAVYVRGSSGEVLGNRTRTCEAEGRSAETGTREGERERESARGMRVQLHIHSIRMTAVTYSCIWIRSDYSCTMVSIK